MHETLLVQQTRQLAHRLRGVGLRKCPAFAQAASEFLAEAAVTIKNGNGNRQENANAR